LKTQSVFSRDQNEKPFYPVETVKVIEVSSRSKEESLLALSKSNSRKLSGYRNEWKEKVLNTSKDKKMPLLMDGFN